MINVIIKGFVSIYSFNYPRVLVYMLQSTEYQIGAYMSWWWRTNDFNNVARRRTLDMTKRAGMLLYFVRLGMTLQVIAGLLLARYGHTHDDIFIITLGLSVVAIYPIIWGQLIVLPLYVGRLLIVVPAERRLVAKSSKIFANHPATIIAVAGSYGKTTIKELLATILAEGKNVKATPANKNVAVSHAKFAQKLSGKEDVLVIEYGEGQPGDVKKFAQTTNPSIGIITGLAPAHLDKYPSLDDVAEDIFSLADKVGLENTYINTDSPLIKAYAKQGYASYNSQGALGWMVSDVRISAHDTSFVMSKGKQRININSKLIGRHLVGPLALCVALAYKLGLNTEQIQAGTAKVTPYEHRMQPRLLAGAWVIDDTYNGNLEGIRAGLALLSELKAKRKIYVTPGLVDQGAETQKVHIEIGELIAKANPDRVILMDNSVTKWIHRGLTKMGYKGELIIQDDPLAFYSNLDQVVATGDVVLMQNDWTDNYN